MRRLWGLAWLAACVPALTPADLCGEAAQAVALRTLQCTDDPDLANAAYDAWVEATRCHAEVDTGSVAGLMACPAELLAAPCDEVRLQALRPTWWYRRSSSCVAMVHLDQTSPTTTPPEPTSDVPGSCAQPLLVDLSGDAAFTETQQTLAVDLPDIQTFTNCGPDQPVDAYLDVSTDPAGDVWVQVDGAIGQAGTLPVTPCDGYLAVCTAVSAGATPTV